MKRLILGLLLSAAVVGASANEGMTKAFSDLDTNTDGRLSSTEIGSQKQLSADFRVADSNGDGYLSESEYNAWTAQKPKTSEPRQTPADAPADTPASTTP